MDLEGAFDDGNVDDFEAVSNEAVGLKEKQDMSGKE